MHVLQMFSGLQLVSTCGQKPSWLSDEQAMYGAQVAYGQ
jgi:hypothetical protein